MPKRSTIDKLPSELREQIGAYLKETRSVDEFAELVNELLEEQGSDERVSRSSAHRYMQRHERLGARLRQSQELAQRFGDDLKGLADDKRIRYLASLVQELAYGYIDQRLEDGAAAEDPKALAALGRLTRDLGAALKDSAGLEIQLRDHARAEIVEEVVRKAIVAAEAGAAKAGVQLGREALDQIRAEMGLIR
ncbi:phage protein Gp27 family protein [Algihabitans albus]|uniref:phage protein Gp27 family protein n=1 Tax=Algihabitans albus TaxID=2164067 RepID=UPI000E5D3177|nr:phage protein Gp27 family protein [Algihabitans albus]